MSNVHYVYEQYADINDKDQTIGGIKTFTSFPVFATSTQLPTTNGQFATKYYVDNVGAGGFTAGNVMASSGLKVFGTSPEKVGVDFVTTSAGITDAWKIPMLRQSDGYLDSSFGGAAGGIAQLDANQKVVQNPASATSTPTANMIPIANASGTLNSSWLPLLYSFFGTGQDGDITVSVSTTLTRDYYYNNLTINTGVVLNPGGYKIYVKNTLTFVGTGKIAANGNNGSAAVNETKGNGGTVLTNGTIFGSSYAGGGFSGVASDGVGGSGTSASTTNPSIGVAGGNGGAGGSTNGKAGGGGGTSATTSAKLFPYDIFTAFNLIQPGTTIYQLQGSSSGGGGGSGGLDDCAAGTSWAGGGGGGATSGGAVSVYAKNVVTVNGNVYLQAIGGNGGNGGDARTTGTPDPAGGGGGGGAGSGGTIVLVYFSKTGTGTIDVSAGTPGTGGAAVTGDASCGSPRNVANAGASGSVGIAGKEYSLQISL
jgi:hypothetical protein